MIINKLLNLDRRFRLYFVKDVIATKKAGIMTKQKENGSGIMEFTLRPLKPKAGFQLEKMGM
ncbi:MAG: hypothetical protein PHG69_01640 [Candidatus Omnitrophica bacterium]|nr:hypothetical protein [Candidatus Omnitrophota bacterium]